MSSSPTTSIGDALGANWHLDGDEAIDSNNSTRQESLCDDVVKSLAKFTNWLQAYGELSYDHQSFFAGPLGGRAKALYYRHRLPGTFAVAPMIFFEAFLPVARRMFFRPMRFPIADAHYAMGFAYLYQVTGQLSHLEKSVHFLNELKKSRCGGYKEYCWGYPFDWVWRGGVIKAQTPLITTTPYVFEAFLQGHELQPSAELKSILESIVRHAISDIRDFKCSETASTCSYTPHDERGVVNASAYRAFMLIRAAQLLGWDPVLNVAERNLNFVLEAQNTDGSWPYAKDGVRHFVDHFHTCFVLKALAKIHSLTGERRVLEALNRGVSYYIQNIFAEDGMPRPFSQAPRLTVYKRELYDCAECINLCLLLRDRFPELGATLKTTVAGILKDWIKPDGSFRSRQLLLGWDNVPMHRWAQSQMFRSLAFYYYQESRKNGLQTGPKPLDATSIESDFQKSTPQLSTLV
jgi:hypothetical protein